MKKILLLVCAFSFTLLGCESVTGERKKFDLLDIKIGEPTTLPKCASNFKKEVCIDDLRERFDDGYIGSIRTAPLFFNAHVGKYRVLTDDDIYLWFDLEMNVIFINISSAAKSQWVQDVMSESIIARYGEPVCSFKPDLHVDNNGKTKKFPDWVKVMVWELGDVSIFLMGQKYPGKEAGLSIQYINGESPLIEKHRAKCNT